MRRLILYHNSNSKKIISGFRMQENVVHQTLQRRCGVGVSVQKVDHPSFPLADFPLRSNSARLPLQNSRSADSRYSSRRGLYSAMQFRRHGCRPCSRFAPETYFFVPPVAMPASVFSAVFLRVTNHESRGAPCVILRQPARPAQRAAFALNLLLSSQDLLTTECKMDRELRRIFLAAEDSAPESVPDFSFENSLSFRFRSSL